MENPTFKLERIVRTQSEENFEDFEGPLNLILQLLAKNKIEIQDIQISQLLEQYLAYLDEMKAMDLEIASDFVVMASHLVYIKARTLLSAGEENEELEELRQSLEKLKNRDIYYSIRKIVPYFEQMYLKGAGTIVKPPEYLEPDKGYKYIHDKKDILDGAIRAMTRGNVPRTLDTSNFAIPKRIIYSVSEKTNEIIASLKGSGPKYLELIFKESHSRTEVVATFLAVLELCKSGAVKLEGDGKKAMLTYVDGT